MDIRGLGLDRDREEVRSFRLSRFLSDVEEAGIGSVPPEGFDAGRQLSLGPWGPAAPVSRARVAFSPRVAWWATSGLPDATVARTRKKDGWVEVSLPAPDGPEFASWILSFGPDAEVLSPRSLRAEVTASLEGTLAAL